MSETETRSETAEQEPATETATDLETDDPAEWKAIDDRFDVLSNHRRRRVLTNLAENDTAVVGELAEHIAAIENDKPAGALSSQERKRVYIALYQSHLPKMADAGIVDYDKNRGTVSLTEHGASLCSLLESPRQPRRWSRYYLVHTAVTALGIAVATVLLNIGAGLAAGAFLLGYALLAVAHGVAEYGSATSDEPFDIVTDSSESIDTSR